MIDLQGNIRVFCRVRPLVGEELFGNNGEIQHMNFPDEGKKTLELERLTEVSLSEVRAEMIESYFLKKSCVSRGLCIICMVDRFCLVYLACILKDTCM